MPPLRYTLRHNATTFDWELCDSGSGAASSHHVTRSSAFARLAADPRIDARGATVQVFGADGGFEHEHTVAIGDRPAADGIDADSRLAA